MTETVANTIGKYTIAALIIIGVIVLMALGVVPVSAGLPVITLVGGYKAGTTVGAKVAAAKKQ